ncbi:ACP phosphodiesterase [Pantoea sp. A4]|uniref:ACP phosphodiesterase n=1 Tax=Pantoea sp. A4 TaxID=1225184 RepID=UPI00037E23F7|nr:ACP phosphodiesterase [Pantoea sp. A4]
MNFLAHLHLAHLADSSLLGNLLGDFIRGNPHDAWPEAVADGILMHRRLDAMTDALPEVDEAKQLFRGQTRRVAPITLDVVWDHFLARHWQELHPQQSLTAFVDLAEQAIVPHQAGTPEGFIELNAIMWRQRWLEHYATADYLAPVLNGMAHRRPRLSALRDSYDDFITNYAALEQFFFRFYPRLMQLARQKQL